MQKKYYALLTLSCMVACMTVTGNAHATTYPAYNKQYINSYPSLYWSSGCYMYSCYNIFADKEYNANLALGQLQAMHATPYASTGGHSGILLMQSLEANYKASHSK